MQEALERLRESLRANGYSLTAPREAVFTALMDSKPLSLAELAKQLSGSANRSSIYRVVDLYEQLGIVTRLQIGWKYKLELSDTFSAHHHHMTCIQCGKIYEIEENAIIEYEMKQLATEHDFEMSGHQLEIRGICMSCKKK